MVVFLQELEELLDYLLAEELTELKEQQEAYRLCDNQSRECADSPLASS
jgi:hypothetical protein